ncbi:unnamed protein product [Clonostachys rosea]|uniref:DUF7924 domain-containing protein n=1 Tax=Bionectria ochroleuca TaxID=29856 RepID=A0ABY6TQH2_BIOOC|nr:unnamed protein product [Clonostachys rosea]
MFGTRSRVRLEAYGERTGPASRIKIQPNLVVLVPGPRPEQKEQKAPDTPRPQPKESTHIVNPRPIGPRQLVKDWLEGIPASGPERGGSQSGSRLSERLAAMAPSQPTISGLCARMDIDQPSSFQSNNSYQALAQRPGYRDTLMINGIQTIPSEQELPENIRQMLKDILPQEPLQFPILDQPKYHKLRNMAIEGTKEAQVGLFLSSESLSKATDDRYDLVYGLSQLLERWRVPTTNHEDRVSTPKPDYYLGYPSKAFPKNNLDVLKRIDSSEIKFPFLEIEYKGDGSNSFGRLWVATNQCLGGTATFLNILDYLKVQLNYRSLKTESEALEPIVFSVVTNGTEARLFVSFSDEKGNFKMSLIRGFLFYQDQGFEKLDAYLTKIIEWGVETRLGHIKNALKTLSDSYRPAENPQIVTDGLDVAGEREEGPPTPIPQAENPVAEQPFGNDHGGQPVQPRRRGRPRKDQTVQMRGRGRLSTKRNQDHDEGNAGRPSKRSRPT